VQVPPKTKGLGGMHLERFWYFCILAIYFYKSSQAFQRESKANFVVVGKSGPTPRVHPLLLSLAEVFKESHKSPQISSISEDDPRVLSNNYYTPPSEFPPLDTHFPGQNGAGPLSDIHTSPLTSAASCRECMASEPQDNSAEAADVGKNMPSVTSSAEELLVSEQNNLAEERDTIINMPSKGNKRRRGSSSGVRSESFMHMSFWH
jgi:hypothetical protein